MSRPSDLPVRGARGEARGHGDEKRGTLQVVRSGEGLPGASALAVETEEPRDTATVAELPVGAVPLEPQPGSLVSDAFGPGAKGRMEPRRSHRFDGLFGPLHPWTREQDLGRDKPPGTPGFTDR